MKKTILILAVLLFSVFQTVNANPGTKVPTPVQQSFEKQFSKEAEVTWKKVRDMYVGAFIQNGEVFEVYVTEEGEILGSGRYILQQSLPIAAKETLVERFNGYTVNEVFEYNAAEGGTRYYLIMENVKATLVVMIDGYNVTVEKKTKK